MTRTVAGAAPAGVVQLEPGELEPGELEHGQRKRQSVSGQLELEELGFAGRLTLTTDTAGGIRGPP